MLDKGIAQGRRQKPHYAVSLAADHDEVREAQRLRFRVFAEEMGAHLNSDNGVDEDEFDPHCDHLLVRDDCGEVVGTYRILPPDAAARLGRFYSDQEFDLGRLAHLRTSLVEVGRSCIHPDFRHGSVISLLWTGLARYVLENGYTHLIGCASIGMADGGSNAAAMYRKLSEANIAPPEYRVFPRNPLPLRNIETAGPVVVPPLIKGYLRLGAYVCGDPAWDPDFNTADLLVLLPVARIDQRYARHFMGAAGGDNGAGAA